MPTKNFLIFDFGASNGRASVAGFDGKKFSLEVIHRFDNVPVFATGTLYWDFLSLFSELKAGLLSAFKKFNNIESLGIDTWGVDFGLIDKNGKLISSPINYRDEKRNSVSKEVFKIIPEEEIFKLTGCALASYYSIFNMYSLKKQNSTEYNNANKFLMMADLFNYFLTGTALNEYTSAHSTLMCSPYDKKWEYKIIDKLGFSSDIFCEIVQPGTKIGKLEKSICSELEISKPISVVAPACHDTPSAIAGIPAVDRLKNIMFISIGTWGITIVEIDKPLVNHEVFESGFANEAGVEGITLLFKNFTGMWLLQQCRNRWVKDMQEEISWDYIMNSAKNADPIGSFIDVDATDFVPNQTDMPKTVRKFCKLKGQKVPETMGQVARVVYESLALKVKHNLKTVEKILKKKMDLIYMIGGGAKDVFLCQLVSNATGLSINAGSADTTSIGNLLMQLKAAGEIKNLDEGRQVSLNSSVINNYAPKNSALWDDLYIKYLRLSSTF